jgi:hypothetical protein
MKSQSFQRDIAATIARAPQVAANIDMLEEMRSDSPGVAATGSDTTLALAAAKPVDNAALDDWRAARVA